MELYHTTDHRGVSELNPSIKKMRALIDSLDERSVDEADHPDISLVHDPSGWSLSVYPSGIVTLENLDDLRETTRYMKDVSRNQAHKLWIKLSCGEIAYVKNLPWILNEA